MCTPSISVGQFRLVKTAEAPHDTIHLYLVPPEFAGDALKRLRFSEDMPLGAVILPIPKAQAGKFRTSALYAVNLREEP